MRGAPRGNGQGNGTCTRGLRKVSSGVLNKAGFLWLSVNFYPLINNATNLEKGVGAVVSSKRVRQGLQRSRALEGLVFQSICNRLVGVQCCPTISVGSWPSRNSWAVGMSESRACSLGGSSRSLTGNLVADAGAQPREPEAHLRGSPLGGHPPPRIGGSARHAPISPQRSAAGPPTLPESAKLQSPSPLQTPHDIRLHPSPPPPPESAQRPWDVLLKSGSSQTQQAAPPKSTATTSVPLMGQCVKHLMHDQNTSCMTRAPHA